MNNDIKYGLGLDSFDVLNPEQVKTKAFIKAHSKEALEKGKLKGSNWYVTLPTEKELETVRDTWKTSKHSHKKVCRWCQTIFDYGRVNSRWCGACRLFIKCQYCPEYHEPYDARETSETINNLGEFNFTAAKCLLKYRNGTPEMRAISVKNGTKRGKDAASKIGTKGICKICKEECVIVDVSGRCQKCCTEQNGLNLSLLKLPGECRKCKVWNEVRDQSGRGISDCDCSHKWFKEHNSSPKMIEASIRNIMYYNNDKYNGQFLTFNGEEFLFKGQPTIELVEELNNKTVTPPSNFKNVEGEWYYNGYNILTGEELETIKFFKFNPNTKELAFRDIRTDKFCKLLDEGKVENMRHIYKIKHRWFYFNVDILTAKRAKLINNDLILIDDEFYYKGELKTLEEVGEIYNQGIE